MTLSLSWSRGPYSMISTASRWNLSSNMILAREGIWNIHPCQRECSVNLYHVCVHECISFGQLVSTVKNWPSSFSNHNLSLNKVLWFKGVRFLQNYQESYHSNGQRRSDTTGIDVYILALLKWYAVIHEACRHARDQRWWKATSDCKPVIALEGYMKTGQSRDLCKQRLFGILYTETRKQMRKQWIIELANVVSSNFYPNILCRRSIRGLFNKEIHVVPVPCFFDLCPRLMLQYHDARAAFS